MLLATIAFAPNSIAFGSSDDYEYPKPFTKPDVPEIIDFITHGITLSNNNGEYLVPDEYNIDDGNGFKWYDEFKIMGMSAYGEPKYQEEIEQLYSFDKSNGKIRLNFKYFDFQYYGMSKLFSDNIEELLGKPRRVENKVTQKEYDIAASLQKVTNKYGISMAKLAKEITGSKNLCLAGGVSQNCLMTQAICNADLFDNVFIQPLSGDVGSALGGALYQYHNKYKKSC